MGSQHRRCPFIMTVAELARGELRSIAPSLIPCDIEKKNNRYINLL